MIPTVSVVIPVHNTADHLKQCLEALRASDLMPAECIVVDDGSTDDSAGVATRFGAKVLSTNGRFGPSRARNLGVQSASGNVILFLDADVCVRPDTVSKIAAEFSRDPDLDAVMGSYDNTPSAPGYVSQFRNLMHCFVHQHSKREATTFWAGCGAIRRQVFVNFGGFNEIYRSPSIEDIELGYRMAKAGRKLALSKDIRVTHLKQWGFRNMMRTDFFYRALPWSELSLRTGQMPNDLNLRISQRISVALSVILTFLAVYFAIHHRAYFVMPLLATFFILLSRYWIESSFSRAKGPMILMAAILGIMVALGYQFRMYNITLAVLAAWLAVYTRHRYAYSREVWRRRTGVLVGGYLLAVMLCVWYYLPWHRLEWLSLVLLLSLLILNKQFYTFLAADRGKLFAFAAIPFHLLYFASAGLAFTVAVVRHGVGRLATTRPRRPPFRRKPRPETRFGKRDPVKEERGATAN